MCQSVKQFVCKGLQRQKWGALCPKPGVKCGYELSDMYAGAKLRSLETTASSLNHSTISQTKDIKILFLPPPNLNILGDQEKDKALLCLLMISGRKKIKNSSNKFSSQEVCDFFFLVYFWYYSPPPTSEMRIEPTLGLHSEPRVLKAFYQRARSTIPEF